MYKRQIVGAFGDIEDGGSRLTISDQDIVVTGNISVDDANLLSATTTGTVTASITTTESITELKTLDVTSNAYTIVISSADATATAEDLSAIDGKTTATIDATAVTSISGTYDQITALYESAGVDNLGDEAISISDELTVTEANVIDGLTTGAITATIGNSRVSELVGGTPLLNANNNNAYTIAISSEDAAVSASDLNAINALTTEAVDLTNVTSITSSSLADLETLGNAILVNGEFSNATGATTVAVSDATIDATTLAATIDSLDFINGLNTTLMTLASGATINIDASEIATILGHETGSIAGKSRLKPSTYMAY